MFKNILLATDGSNHAERALDVAADLAQKYDAELLIIHVLMHGKVPQGFRRMSEVEHIGGTNQSRMEDLYNLPGNMLTTMRRLKPEVSEDAYFDFLAEHIVAQSEKTAKKAGVKTINSRIVSGDPVEEILAASASEHADLIVLGTRGIGPLKRLLLGSVAHKISQQASCPCLTVI